MILFIKRLTAVSYLWLNCSPLCLCGISKEGKFSNEYIWHLKGRSKQILSLCIRQTRNELFAKCHNNYKDGEEELSPKRISPQWLSFAVLVGIGSQSYIFDRSYFDFAVPISRGIIDLPEINGSVMAYIYRQTQFKLCKDLRKQTAGQCQNGGYSLTN